MKQKRIIMKEIEDRVKRMLVSGLREIVFYFSMAKVIQIHECHSRSLEHTKIAFQGNF